MEEMAAIDVEHIESNGDAGHTLGLGDQLSRQERRRHRIKNLNRIESDPAATPEPPGWQRSIRAPSSIVMGMLREGSHQPLAVAEVPIESRA
jgi:hypothetical protein